MLSEYAEAVLKHNQLRELESEMAALRVEVNKLLKDGEELGVVFGSSQQSVKSAKIGMYSYICILFIICRAHHLITAIIIIREKEAII
jgi:hypothetical protein